MRKLLAVLAFPSVVFLSGPSSLGAQAAGPPPATNFQFSHLLGRLQTNSGFVNPAVLVGFNPQPEPPGGVLNLHNASAPVFSWANETDHYGVIFGFDLGGPVTFTGPDPVPLHTFHLGFSSQTSAGGPEIVHGSASRS